MSIIINVNEILNTNVNNKLKRNMNRTKIINKNNLRDHPYNNRNNNEKNNLIKSNQIQNNINDIDRQNEISIDTLFNEMDKIIKFTKSNELIEKMNEVDSENICLQFNTAYNKLFLLLGNNYEINLNNYKNYLKENHKCSRLCEFIIYKVGQKIIDPFNKIDDRNFNFKLCSKTAYVCNISGYVHYCNNINDNCEFTEYIDKNIICFASHIVKYQYFSVKPNYDEKNKISIEGIEQIDKIEISNLSNIGQKNETEREQHLYVTEDIIQSSINSIIKKNNNNNNNNQSDYNLIRNSENFNSYINNSSNNNNNNNNLERYKNTNKDKDFKDMTYEELINLIEIINYAKINISFIQVIRKYNISRAYVTFLILNEVKIKSIRDEVKLKLQKEEDKNYVTKDSYSFITLTPKQFKISKYDASYKQQLKRNAIEKRIYTESFIKSTTLLNDQNKIEDSLNNILNDIENINDKDNNKNENKSLPLPSLPSSSINNNNNSNSIIISQIDNFIKKEKEYIESLSLILNSMADLNVFINIIEKRDINSLLKSNYNSTQIKNNDIVIVYSMIINEISKRYKILDKNISTILINRYIFNFIEFWKKIIKCKHVNIKHSGQRWNVSFIQKSLLYVLYVTQRKNLIFDFSIPKKFLLENGLKENILQSHKNYNRQVNAANFKIYIIEKNNNMNFLIDVEKIKYLNYNRDDKKKNSRSNMFGKNTPKLSIKTNSLNTTESFFIDCLVSLKIEFLENTKQKLNNGYDKDNVIINYINQCLNIKFDGNILD